MRKTTLLLCLLTAGLFAAPAFADHPSVSMGEDWTLELKYRYYQQSAADFYSDLFEFESQDENDWRARDKELSKFNNHTLSLYASYARALPYRFAESAAITLQWDHIWFDYENFTDLRVEVAVPGEEPTYDFEADVFKLVFTLWY
jgi:hypothetical protein